MSPPCHRQPAPSDHTQQPTRVTERQRPAQILIVEDQSLIRQALRLMIEARAPECLVHEEASYEGALRSAADKHYDLVFLDIDLGRGRSGLDLLRDLRLNHPSSQVIMLSGNEERDMVDFCLAQGASGYISKASDDGAALLKALLALDLAPLTAPTCPPPAPAPLAGLGLSPRKYEVLYHLCQGLSNKAIARRMGIEEATVRKSYVTDLLRTFGVSRRTELMAEIGRRGLQIPPPQAQA